MHLPTDLFLMGGIFGVCVCSFPPILNEESGYSLEADRKGQEMKKRDSSSLIKLSSPLLVCTNFCTANVEGLRRIVAPPPPAPTPSPSFIPSESVFQVVFLRTPYPCSSQAMGGGEVVKEKKRDCITSFPFLTSERLGKGQL